MSKIRRQSMIKSRCFKISSLLLRPIWSIEYRKTTQQQRFCMLDDRTLKTGATSFSQYIVEQNDSIYLKYTDFEHTRILSEQSSKLMLYMLLVLHWIYLKLKKSGTQIAASRYLINLSSLLFLPNTCAIIVRPTQERQISMEVPLEQQ